MEYETREILIEDCDEIKWVIDYHNITTLEKRISKAIS